MDRPETRQHRRQAFANQLSGAGRARLSDADSGSDHTVAVPHTSGPQRIPTRRRAGLRGNPQLRQKSSVTSVTPETSQLSDDVDVPADNGCVTDDRLRGYTAAPPTCAPTSGVAAVTDVTDPNRGSAPESSERYTRQQPYRGGVPHRAADTSVEQRISMHGISRSGGEVGILGALLERLSVW